MVSYLTNSRTSTSTGQALQRARSIISTLVAVIIIVAVELSIKWNAVYDVNTLDSAGQLIPFTIGVVTACHVVWVYYYKDPKTRVGKKMLFTVEPRFASGATMELSRRSVVDLNVEPRFYAGAAAAPMSELSI